jgi:hypothetical protein
MSSSGLYWADDDDDLLFIHSVGLQFGFYRPDIPMTLY